MDYFRRLLQLLKTEKEEDRRQYEQLTATLSVAERRENGMTWYPVAIKDTELGRGDYLTVELERTTHQDLVHQLRFGMTAALFSNHDPRNQRVEGTITHISGNRLKLSLRTDELPDWSRDGKLGIDAVFDENSYREMEAALKTAELVAEKKEEGRLVRVLTGQLQPTFQTEAPPIAGTPLNDSQLEAVEKILRANELAIVHGPPGTGKTTTLVQAIKMLVRHHPQQVLVTAPSNAAVDLLSERLADAGLNVVRVGNPARVNEKQLALTLDSRMAAHSSMKQVRQMRKQVAEYRDLAQKYKRQFGPAERAQRKALFAEARNLVKDIEATEQYIAAAVLSKADVITATLVGASHHTVRHLSFETVVIDEAGQALEPACWVPVLKGRKLVMAGDHLQLPPTIRSQDAAAELGLTLMEKNVALHPTTVTLLQEQYRMHQAIMAFPSQEFYESRLKAHSSVAEAKLWPDDDPLLFIDTAGCGYEEFVEGNGISNPEEAGFLLNHLNRFAQEWKQRNAPPVSIGVISPYRHQVELLKELLPSFDTISELGAAVSVNTIDSFQGQERDVVYIGLTRSNADRTIGFLSEIRRMNVAMTRARKKLVVVGDSSTISQFPFYSDFIAYAQEQNAYRSAWEYLQ